MCASGKELATMFSGPETWRVSVENCEINFSCRVSIGGLTVWGIAKGVTKWFVVDGNRIGATFKNVANRFTAANVAKFPSEVSVELSTKKI